MSLQLSWILRLHGLIRRHTTKAIRSWPGALWKSLQSSQTARQRRLPTRVRRFKYIVGNPTELNRSSPGVDRIPWVDLMRSVSILLVIIIHTAGPLAYQWENIPHAEWMAGNFYNAFARV